MPPEQSSGLWPRKGLYPRADRRLRRPCGRFAVTPFPFRIVTGGIARGRLNRTRAMVYGADDTVRRPQGLPSPGLPHWSIGAPPLDDKQNMTILLYRTRFCPRCALARKHLLALIGDQPELQLEEREVLSSWKDARVAGIRMIPAIRVGNDILSGIYLTRDDIRRFLQQTGCL